MLAELPAPIERDSDDLVMFTCRLQCALRAGNDREARKMVGHVLHRAKMIETWLPKEASQRDEH